MSATITRLPASTPPAQSHLARELRYLKARNARRIRRQLNQPPRDRLKWRRLACALGIQTCDFCGGSGEVAFPGIYGEYEGEEPCPRCQTVLPNLPFEYDDTPF